MTIWCFVLRRSTMLMRNWGQPGADNLNNQLDLPENENIGVYMLWVWGVVIVPGAPRHLCEMAPLSRQRDAVAMTGRGRGPYQQAVLYTRTTSPATSGF